MKKPLTYDEFKTIYSKVPRLSIDIVLNQNGKIALIERALQSYQGQWHLPGGTLYFKETVPDALRRIAKDETGFIVEPYKNLGYIEYHSEEKERGFGYTIGLVFECEIVGGKLALNDEGTKLQYFEKLPENTVIDQKLFLQSIGYQ